MYVHIWYFLIWKWRCAWRKRRHLEWRIKIVVLLNVSLIDPYTLYYRHDAQLVEMPIYLNRKPALGNIEYAYYTALLWD